MLENGAVKHTSNVVPETSSKIKVEYPNFLAHVLGAGADVQALEDGPPQPGLNPGSNNSG